MITTTASTTSTTSTATTAASIMSMSTSTATTTSTATVSMHFATLPMSMMPMIQAPQAPSADALDRAISVGNARAREMQDQMLASAFQLAFNMGDKFRLLKDEQTRLRSEIALQKCSIELLESQHQEKWIANVEAAKVRMRAIASKISEIVKSIETQSEIDFGVVRSAPTDPYRRFLYPCFNHHAWRYYFYCNCLRDFQSWLKSVDCQCTKPLETRCAKQSIPKSTLTQGVDDVMTHSEVSTQMVAFPQLAPFIQASLVQERETVAEKQELASLKQLYESKKKDYQNSLAAWKNRYSFEPCLERANTIKKTIETYIVSEKEHYRPYPQVLGEHTGIEEATRLKGLVCAIIPDIEQAMAWMKGVNA